MDPDLSKLSDDAHLPKHVIAALADALDLQYQEKIHYLEERIRLLQNELFGRKSEKHYPEDHRQLSLFEGGDPKDDSDEASADSTIVVPTHKRKKRGRRPLPEHLPRVDRIHDLPEEEKVCQCGATLTRCGQDECEKLDYIPAKVRVIHHIRYKYACKSCEGVEDDGPTIKIAPLPLQLIPKSIVTAGLLAHIIVSKFADALPFYRQQKIFARLDIDLSRANMANWVIQAAEHCRPLIDLFLNEIHSGPLIHIDESPLQVLKEPGRANTSKSYMWVYCGGQINQPTVLYQYHPTRSGRVALQFLNNYQGFIQTDDFSGYDYLSAKDGVIHLGCWAHARRKFVDVVKVRKKNRGNKSNPKGLADQALDYIGQLYLLEKQARQSDMAADQIYALRQEKAKPILDEFKNWLDKTEPLTPPQGLLGKAIKYTLGIWSKLCVYIEDGRLKPDNNTAENAIRPFVLGRKNWLFAGHPKGAAACATFLSLIETAKANDLEPFAYLRYLFEQLPLANTQEEYRALLPQYFDPKLINAE